MRQVIYRWKLCRFSLCIPVVGGYLADKYLGFRKAVIFGGVLLVLGHLGLAYEGNAKLI
jgi:dipeptide/tripeptide permease